MDLVRNLSRLGLHFWVCCLLSICSGVAFADYTLNMPVGVTPVSREVYYLHMVVIWICVAIGVIVFGAMAWCLYFHRKSRGAVAVKFHENNYLEAIWSIIPFVILVVIAYPSTKTLLFMEDGDDSELTVKVTGHMWKWSYDYIDYGITFASNLTTTDEAINNRDIKSENYLREVDNPMVVPINKKIRILTTASDVLHSWWVPELAVKKDTIPGFINETWTKIEKPGIYRGQCAELCGVGHGYMPIVVEAVTEDEFEQWVAGKQKKKGG